MLSTITKLIPAFLVYAWLVTKASWYWQNREDLQFGWVVLLLSLYLIYEKLEDTGKNLEEGSVGWISRSIGGISIVCGVAILFQFQIYTSSLGMKPAALVLLTFGVFLVIFGNLLFSFGFKGIKSYAFGFLFLAISLPMPSIVHGIVVNGLQNVVSAITVEFLNLIGTPAKQIGSLIELPGGTVGVDEACSGIRSLQSTVMATLFIGYLSLKSIGTQCLLFVSGIALAVIGNLIRAIYLSHIANVQGIEAVEKHHDGAGYSILAFTVVGVSLLAWLISRGEKVLMEEAAVEQ